MGDALRGLGCLCADPKAGSPAAPVSVAAAQLLIRHALLDLLQALL